MPAPYSCVREFMYELKTDKANTNSPDKFHALSYLKQATARFDAKLGIAFTPRFETRQFDPRSWHIDSNKNWLLLPSHLLSVSELTDGNGTVLDPAIWFPCPVGVVPFHTIQLVTRSAINPFGGAALSFYTTINPQYFGESNTKLTGVWGWHPDYANALTDCMDSVQDNPLSSVAKVIHVDNVDGGDIFGRQPRFSPGQLLKVNDEYMELAATNDEDNTLVVLRGQVGTTATSHNRNSDILVWEPPDDIARACARFACFPYKRRGDFSARSFDTATGASTMLPKGIPTDILNDLQNYANGVPDGGWLVNSVW